MKRNTPTVIHSQQQTVVRRVIPPRDNSQMNAVNKINSLPSVSVSTQPKFVRQSIYSTTQSAHKCFICDENIIGAATSLTDSETITSREKVTKKLAKMVGDDFCVIVSEDDVICRRCLTLFNTMDKYESDMENVRNRLRGFINKKYGIDDEEPPVKIQRLNSGSPNYNRFQNNTENTSPIIRKIAVGRDTADSQLKSLSGSPNNLNAKRGPIKLYKCIACDFKTTDLQAFQPHSTVCKGQTNKNQSSPGNTQTRIVRQTYSGATGNTVRQIMKSPEKSPQRVGGTTIVRNSVPQSQLQCRTCSFKTADKVLFHEHQRVHMKQTPFKCRMCLERFETREAAQIHAKTHSNPTNGWKCGICSRQFAKREVFDAHMKTHEKFRSVTKEEVVGKKSAVQIQKPLTEIIKEALSEDDQNDELIEFHSCPLCSLTFLNKKIYAQHMKTHESSTEKTEKKSALTKGKQQDTLGDLESIFEKMHSENAHQTAASNGATSDKNVLITTQEGGITYNITIPQDDIPQSESEEKHDVRIDMPALGGSDEKDEVHVSMPSLHGEEEDNTQSSQEQTEVQESGEPIPMDLEDLQNAAGEGQQLKFIVDENGQFLQLDNHILTTDAEGNQILVQGTDQEQLQHLLQSVGVDGQQMLVQLQGNGEGIDGEGTTLQMLGDGAQGQMILVQGEDGESQLIDASMLQTEGGNLVLQQGADGETHLTTADGIPVSVSFASGEGGEGHITVTMAGGEEGQQIFLQHPDEEAEGGAESQEPSGETASEFSQSQEESSQEASTGEALASQEVMPEADMTAECATSITEGEQKDEVVPEEDAEPKKEAPHEEKHEVEEENKTEEKGDE